MSVQQIFSATNAYNLLRDIGNKDMQTRLSELEDNLAAGEDKYSRLRDVYKDGVAPMLNKLKADAQRSSNYSVPAQTANVRLNQEVQFLDQMSTIMQQYLAEVGTAANGVSGTGNITEDLKTAGDKALDRLESILNSSVEGRYFFGGLRANQAPISAPLKSSNELPATAPNIVTFAVSDIHDVATGLHAGESFITNFIKTVRKLSTVDILQPAVAKAAGQVINDSIAAAGASKMQKLINQNILADADQYNKTLNLNAQSGFEANFTTSYQEKWSAIQNLSDSQSLLLRAQNDASDRQSQMIQYLT